MSFAHNALISGRVFFVCKSWSRHAHSTSAVWRQACYAQWPSASKMPGLRDFRSFFLKRAREPWRGPERGPPDLQIDQLYFIVEAEVRTKLWNHEVRRSFSAVLPFADCMGLSATWDMVARIENQFEFLWDSAAVVEAVKLLSKPSALLAEKLPWAAEGDRLVRRWPSRPASEDYVAIGFAALWCAASEMVVFLIKEHEPFAESVADRMNVIEKAAAIADVADDGTLSNFCLFGLDHDVVWGRAADRISHFIRSLEPDWEAMEEQFDDEVQPTLNIMLDLAGAKAEEGIAGVSLCLELPDVMWQDRDKPATATGHEVGQMFELMWWE